MLVVLALLSDMCPLMAPACLGLPALVIAATGYAVIAAMKAGQIDAALFDLPTALFTSAVLMDNGAILGQFDPAAAENPDQFGALMPEGTALKACVDEALAALIESGALAAIEAEWLQDTTGVPLIE